jgi:uncharacterized membrane protein
MQIRGFWAWAILVALLLSLGANFFLAGFLFERFRRGGGPPPMVRMLEDFPPPLRRQIARELWQERAQFRPTVAEIWRKRNEIAEAMRQPTIDRARIRGLMAEVRTLTGTLVERSQEAVLDAIERIPAEQRARIGESAPWRGRPPPWLEDDGPRGPSPTR